MNLRVSSAMAFLVCLSAVSAQSERAERSAVRRPARSQPADARAGGPRLAASRPAASRPAEQPDDPRLPRVLLIGDSISIGYTQPTKSLLAGKANVHRIPTNGGPTTRGLESLDEWLGDGRWDVIHFNWGLHDLKFMEDGKHQVDIEAYERNLEKLVQRLKKTKAVLIWASTTPVPEGKLNPPRKDQDVLAYNAVARSIMTKHNVVINDLYAFAKPRLAELQLPANVHFKPAGSDALAERVAGCTMATLNRARAVERRVPTSRHQD